MNFECESRSGRHSGTVKKVFVSLLGILLATGLLRAAESEPSDYDTVRKADRFSIGGIGVAGTVAKPELALRRILKTDHATEDCQKLVKSGSLPGQLYGLFGLKVLKAPGYTEAAAPYLKSKEMVPCAAGCMLGTQTVAGLAHNIDSGAYR